MKQDIVTVSKGATIADSATVKAENSLGVVRGEDWNLLVITTNGNINHISYRIIDMQGGISTEIEASQKKRILGPVKQIQLIIDTAEAGLNVFVHRFLAPGAFLSAIDVLIPETATTNQSEQIDSTTASIADGGTYTGAFIAIAAWARTILLSIDITQLCLVRVQFSDDGTAVMYDWRAWMGRACNHKILIRGKFVRLVITNFGVSEAGVTATAVSPTTAKLYQTSEPAVGTTTYRYDILSNATLTVTTSFGIRRASQNARDGGNAALLLSVAVHGTVSGTSPTLQIGTAASHNGTALWETEALTTSITVTDTQQQRTHTADVQAVREYIRLRMVLTGTSASFAGTYLTIIEVLEP